MSRIQELKKHNPHWSRSLIDYIEVILMGAKTKYTELFVNLLKQHVKTTYFDFNGWRDELIEFGIDKSIVDNINDFELIYFSRCIQNLIPKHDLTTFKSFIEFNEKNLIGNKDITTIKTFSEVNDLVSLAEMRDWDKELESQVIIELDNAETGWLLLRPLTFESSKKYGSATKWCTTERNSPNYFYRYYKNILVYCINRKTGYKVAMHHIVNENETSFWNSTDQRIDSLLTDLDMECKTKLVELIKEGKSNYELTPEEYRKLEDKYELKETYSEQLPMYILPVIENDLVVRGEGISLTTTGDNVISINGNGAATLTYNYPDWITDISAE
jgi:hypothetical protein